ncbi:30S ribosomal protein S27ae [Methanoplanus sp. FWC-SCC4]|uniref:Small ribosomal subunit protein eS31 n=1 Tax=Methanochimaera problematica TaxID=2609417 RepID=A0AA97FDI7_9EURY|nr:30S ribosomal protein S27ae [Methanoplanus sp. FWC-SCC4]WOF17077.1 30S ribosomal protein S27ae [Methanoplanus sp. FWC-SCC4]
MAVKRHEYYKVEGDNAVAQRRHCPRCGPGVFMAEHKDRVACGKCGYTEFTK